MTTVNKTISATIERIERTTVVLEVLGREVSFPRAALPTPLRDGAEVTIFISVDTSDVARDEVAEELDERTSKRVGSRRKGNPRSASARGTKK